MTEHPITPPPERFKQWEDDILNERDNVDHVLDCAWKDGFRAGADQELEACVKWIGSMFNGHQTWADELRFDRRPKPPSLKEQALRDLDALAKDLERNGMGFGTAMIRRALEALDD